jgi:5'-nucleotidase
MRTRTRLLLAMVMFGVLPLTAQAAQKTLNVMVTNDDGIAAPGIDALVNVLKENPNLIVTVVAPATNQSGTGDKITTTGTLTVTSSMTASSVPGTAVAGFPADTVLFGFKEGLPEIPGLVVSGINAGQNISTNSTLSGTVGAGLWAARLGVPAFAVSAGLDVSGGGTPTNYADAAKYMGTLVEQFRKSGGFQKKMKEKDAPFYGLVLNINFPTCTSGAVRGVRVVPLATGYGVGLTTTSVTGYTETSAGSGTWTPTTQQGTLIGASNCASTLAVPTTDIEGMDNGFATVTPLCADLTVCGAKLKDYKFVEKLWK